MKTTKTFEIEIERHNVTPAQFLAYLRSMQKKHPEMAADFDLNMFSREGWSSNYSNAMPTERPCEAERATDKPYQKQTYIRDFDGTTYNEIIEFDFDDEKTGHGYYYTVQIDVADEDREANTAENVAAIIRRRAEQADRQEVKAEKAEQEANEAERRGYTAQWWIDSKRTEAATLRREAAETRAAIEATQEAQEAPQEAPAAEAEQQPTETENAPQAATQAAESITNDNEKEAETMSSNAPFTPAEAAMHAATARGIISRKGGYRERDIINHPHTVERGTWTTAHKVIEILATTPDPDGYRPGCAVDIVTRSIVG